MSDGPRVLCVNLLLHSPIGVAFVFGVAYFCWIIILYGLQLLNIWHGSTVRLVVDGRVQSSV